MADDLTYAEFGGAELHDLNPGWKRHWYRGEPAQVNVGLWMLRVAIEF